MSVTALDIALLTRAASLYYRERLTQQEIAHRMGVSRQRVSRMLQQAEDVGVVRIEISSPVAEVEAVARRLEETFGLKEAFVVVPNEPGEAQAREAVGKAAALVLARQVRPGMLLGLGWSTSVMAMIEHLGAADGREMRIVQLDGGVPHGPHPNETADIVNRAGLALDAQAIALMTPLYVDTEAIRDALVSDSQIRECLDLGKRCGAAFFGVGTVSRRSNLYATGFLADDLIDELLAEGAVGEILGRFYGRDAKPSAIELSRRTIGLELEALAQVPFRCMIAFGESKVEAILAGLRGKYANAIVTDEATALALLAAA
jgi:deoxyribonucleoside regulator